MERDEALQVIREISAKCGDSVLPLWLSLDCLRDQGYTITLKCDLDERTRDILRALLLRHSLKMEESHGTLIINR